MQNIKPLKLNIRNYHFWLSQEKPVAESLLLSLTYLLLLCLSPLSEMPLFLYPSCCPCCDSTETQENPLLPSLSNHNNLQRYNFAHMKTLSTVLCRVLLMGRYTFPPSTYQAKEAIFRQSWSNIFCFEGTLPLPCPKDFRI